MKILLGLFLCLVFVVNSFGLPLVFKATKEIKTAGEVVTLDTSKYDYVRIGIALVSSFNSDTQIDFRIEAVEETDSFFIQETFLFQRFPTRSIFIDAPPSKIRISANQPGTYKIFAWAK